jgi:hypothetical protein
MWIGFTWLRIQFTDGLIERQETLHVQKEQGIFEQLGKFQLIKVVAILLNVLLTVHHSISAF